MSILEAERRRLQGGKSEKLAKRRGELLKEIFCLRSNIERLAKDVHALKFVRNNL